jgi:hypothetical protein
MNRFKVIPPLDMSDYFVRDEEVNTFQPYDWNMPLPWISAFIFTHCTGHFWGFNGNTKIIFDQPTPMRYMLALKNEFNMNRLYWDTNE